jgi:curli biogenesis system outer membrane secretion channel CsgG
MKKLFLWVVVCLAWVPGSLWAGDIAYSTVSSKGFGDDSGTALRDAIKGAVAQVCGEKIAGSTTVESEAMNSDKGSYSRDKLTEAVRSDTKGILHSYRIVEQGEDARSGRVFVLIEAKVPIYRPSAQTNRLKLAVFPANIDRSVAPGVEVEDIARAMTAAIESSLVETRRFAVIDNIGSGPRRKELAKLSAPEVPLSQSLRAAQTLVADYVVLTNIRTFDFAASGGAVARADGASRPMLNMSVDIRIVDVDSGQIKFAMTESVRRRISGGRSVGDYGVAIGRGFAKRIAGSIYPMVVVAARTGAVTLNEGGSNVSVGSKYFLTAAGAEMTDPYTGESLGAEELRIAIIQIESVTDRTSSARLVEGEVPLDAPPGALIARPMPVDVAELLENFRQRSEALQEAVKGKKKDADEDW